MELLRVEELADRLGVAKSQIYRQTKLGRLPVVRVGRYFRYPWPQVLEYLTKGGASGDDDDEQKT